ncbi:MAG: ABC transporter ATP-binding protein [Peptoniphilaceae bacterium]|nr:ABC transporter ATP-binding protein [Peptoniphilaceae bacterium]
MSEYIVEMNKIVKYFGDVQAIQHGQFYLKKGEIHSLIGENGAGKSTMMKLLYGMYPVTDGEIRIKGNVVEDLDPKKAIDLGIGMVHQEFMLINDLTVLENIILGFEPRKGLKIDFQKAKKDIQHYIDHYNMDIQLEKTVRQISVGEAQRVEIIKTLMRGAEIIILDEPTAVLTPQETIKLFEILDGLKKEGKSIVFISHKLNEVMSISNSISVMRQGKYVGTVDKNQTSELELTKMMIGREVFLNVEKKEGSIGDVVLDVQDIWLPSLKETSKIRGMSFQVRQGEIVGIAGIDGNGQSELIEAITGLRDVEKGKIILHGKNITNQSPRKIRTAGLAHIPEDRNARGLNRFLSIADNLALYKISCGEYDKLGVISQKKIFSDAEKRIKEYDIRPADAKAPTSSLSGGNAQKVVVAREASLGKSLLIASQPTRGVDIGAIESIRNILRHQKAEGTAILLVSAELEEILSLSDRIIVIHEGQITGELMADEANENNLGLLMMGGTIDEEEEGIEK